MQVIKNYILGNSIVLLDDDAGLEGQGHDIRHTGLVLRHARGVCQKWCYATQVRDILVCVCNETDKVQPLL